MKTLLSLILLLCSSVVVSAQGRTSQLYLRLAGGDAITQSAFLEALDGVDASLIKTAAPLVAAQSSPLASTPAGQWWSLTARSPEAAAALVQQLHRHTLVEYTEPARTYKPFSTPNDPLFSLQGYLTRIDAQGAWGSLSQGSNTVTVAVIDDGVAWNHEDLAANIYVNPAETANGQDSDGNGKVDDIRGWDFIGDVSEFEASLAIFREDNNVLNLGSSHGTRAASLIGAVHDNSRGISGLARRVRLLPLKVAPDNPLSRDMFRIPEAILYAIEQGANVIYIGGGRTEELPFVGFSQIEFDIINEAVRRGIVVIAPAGNDGIVGDDRVYPATLPGVIAVGASSASDLPLRTSNSGNYVSLYAPGEQLLSATLGNQYNNNFSGTSAAAALVAGAAALLKLEHPMWSAEAIRQQLLSSSSLIGNSRHPLRYGLLNAGEALRLNRAGNATAPGIGKASDLPWLRLEEEGGGIVEAVSNFQTHNVAVTLLNHLSAADNVTLSLRPVGDTRYARPDTGYAPVVVERWEARQPFSFSFPIKADPSVLTAPQDEPTIQEFIIEARTGDYVAFHSFSVDIIARGEGTRNIAVTPSLHLTNRTPLDTLIIRNIGSEPVTVTSIELEGDGEIELVGMSSLPLTIPVAGERLIGVRVASGQAGEFGATVRTSIALPPDESDDEAPTTATVSALITADIAEQFLSILGTTEREFPATRVGDTASFTFQVQNRGTVAAQWESVISGGGNYRAGTFVVTEIPSPIPPGGVVSGRLLFIPQEAGSIAAAIEIRATGGSGSSVQVSGRGLSTQGRTPYFEYAGDYVTSEDAVRIPATRVGDSIFVQNLFLVNPGRLSSSVSAIVIEGIGASEIQVVEPSGGFTIPAGGRVQVVVAFRPTITGAKSVSFTARGGFDDVQTRFVAVGGTPIAVVPFEVADGEAIEVPVEFLPGFVENVAIGRVGSGFVPLENTRSVPITISGASFTGSHAGEFRVVGVSFPLTLAPGEERDIDIEFRPISEGLKEAVLNLSYAGIAFSDRVIFKPFAFGTRNVVVTEFPAGLPTGDYFQLFPMTVVGEQSSVVRNTGLTNRGSLNENIAASITGRDAADFAITSGSGPFLVEPNGSIDFRVEFVPLTPGRKNAVLRLATQSGIEYSIRLIAEARQRPSFLGSDIIDIGEHAFGEEAIVPIEVRALHAFDGIDASLGTTFPFMFRPTAESELVSSFIFLPPSSGDTLTVDTLFVSFVPADTVEYETQMTLTSGSAQRTYTLRGTGRLPTRPRLLVEREIFFDTIETGNIQQRTLRIVAFNLEEDMRISTSEHFYIFTPDRREVSEFIISRRAVLDTVVSIRFRPRNVLGGVEGSLEIRSGSLEEEVELRFAAVVPRPGLTAEEVVVVPSARVGESSSAPVPLIGALLAPNSAIRVELDAHPDYQLEYAGRRYASGEIISVAVGATGNVQTELMLHFTPSEEDEVYGIIGYTAILPDGFEVNDVTAIEARGVLPPTLSASHDSIRFGRVELFTFALEVVELDGLRLADTVLVRLEQKNPMFTFNVDEFILLQEYTFATDNGDLNADVVVLFEPTDYGFYFDTLRIISGEIDLRIPLFGIGADTTTSIEERASFGSAKVFPTVSSGEFTLLVRCDSRLTAPRSEVYSLLGDKLMEVLPVSVGGSYYRQSFSLVGYPQGVYIVRTYLPDGSIVVSKVIVQ